MSDQRLAYLLQQCLAQTASDREKEELYRLLKEPANEAWLGAYIQGLLEDDTKPLIDLPDDRMRAIVDEIVAAQPPAVVPMEIDNASRFTRRRLWTAAAALILLSLGIYMAGTNRHSGKNVLAANAKRQP